MPLKPGQTLNKRYRIDRRLGQGVSGTAYEAWDLHLGRPRALKKSSRLLPKRAANLNAQTLQPGVYCGGMTFSGPVNITFAPGLYVVKDGVIATSDGGAWSFWICPCAFPFRIRDEQRITSREERGRRQAPKPPRDDVPWGLFSWSERGGAR